MPLRQLSEHLEPAVGEGGAGGHPSGGEVLALERPWRVGGQRPELLARAGPVVGADVLLTQRLKMQHAVFDVDVLWAVGLARQVHRRAVVGGLPFCGVQRIAAELVTPYELPVVAAVIASRIEGPTEQLLLTGNAMVAGQHHFGQVERTLERRTASEHGSAAGARRGPAEHPAVDVELHCLACHRGRAVECLRRDRADRIRVSSIRAHRDSDATRLRLLPEHARGSSMRAPLLCRPPQSRRPQRRRRNACSGWGAFRRCGAPPRSHSRSR